MRITNNRLKSVLKFAKNELIHLYEENEIQSFFYLLCEHYLDMDKTKVILNPEYLLSESELLKFNFAIKDLKKEKPIQYILGEAEFYGFRFQVNEHTLIPRPETEELVRWIDEKEKMLATGNILDIGTGSGCIAISLSKLLPKADVLGIDISDDVLQLAKLNNQNIGASVTFKLIDILNPPENFKSIFDIIVSNPPYVLESEKNLMKKNVLDYEPSLALFVGEDDPLIFYRHIINFAKENLIANGRLYFEINEAKGDEIKSLLEVNKFDQIELKKDFFGRYRMIRATKK